MKFDFPSSRISVLQKMAPTTSSPAKTCGCRWPFNGVTVYLQRENFLTFSFSDRNWDESTLAPWGVKRRDPGNKVGERFPPEVKFYLD